MVNACASWCNPIRSKSKQRDKVFKQNWNVMQLNLISFLTWSLQPKDFCMVVTGTLRQRVGFPGASIHSHYCVWFLPELVLSALNFGCQVPVNHSLDLTDNKYEYGHIIARPRVSHWSKLGRCIHFRTTQAWIISGEAPLNSVPFPCLWFVQQFPHISVLFQNFLWHLSECPFWKDLDK